MDDKSFAYLYRTFLAIGQTKRLKEEKRLEKNARVSEKIKQTKERRKEQLPLVFEFKIQENKLTKRSLYQLNTCFVEAKWIWNYLVSQRDNEEFSVKKYRKSNPKEVIHKDKDFNDILSPLTIGSQLKQGVIDSYINAIKSQIALMDKNLGTGPIKFISEYTSIDLVQYGITYSLNNIHNNRAYLKIQGIKHKYLINGTDQLSSLGLAYEFANAKLVKRADGIFLMCTVYVNKSEYLQKRLRRVKHQEANAFDMGLSYTYTDIFGNTVSCTVQETERLKRLQRKLERQVKGSKCYNKTCCLIRKEYRKIDKKKKDLTDKTIAWMLEWQTVIVQDESIKEWHENGHGKSVQHSVLGRCKARLKYLAEISDRVYILNGYLPSTKLCVDCGKLYYMPVEERTFLCCEGPLDRDQHAAMNMLWFFNHGIGVNVKEMSWKDIVTQTVMAILKDKGLDTLPYEEAYAQVVGTGHISTENSACETDFKSVEHEADALLERQ